MFPLVLVIIDGFGIAPKSNSNPISLANMPYFDLFWKDYPHTLLQASGSAVGLLPYQVGNSEAGHMNIGAGRIVKQDILRIHESIDDGSFYHNPALLQCFFHTQKNKSKVHIMGLLSGPHSGHSHPKHLNALLHFFRLRGAKNVYLHLFTDGRDTDPHDGAKLLENLQKRLLPHEKIVFIGGRLYLDRKKDWTKTQRAYNALVLGEGEKFADPVEYIKQSYAEGISDEFIRPAVLTGSRGKPVGLMRDGDGIVFFNLRSDRARQLTKPFVQKNFNKMNPGSFKRKKVLKNISFVAMTDFGPDLDSVLTAFPSPDVRDTFPVAMKKYRQLYLAESEKFAQVTYFFNGGFTDPVAGEERMKVDSPKVSNYARVPEMSIDKLTKIVIERLDKNINDVIVVNFANADMVGHTGDLRAGIRACEAIDRALGKIYKKLKSVGGIMSITSDHGNVEVMIDSKTHGPNTAHDPNPVPFIIIGEEKNVRNLKLKKEGVLGNVAPTLLDLIDVEKPDSMTCESLIL